MIPSPDMVERLLESRYFVTIETRWVLATVARAARGGYIVNGCGWPQHFESPHQALNHINEEIHQYSG